MDQHATNPTPGAIDDAAALALFAQGLLSIAEIAEALKCTIIELAAWRARRQFGRQVRNVEKLYSQNARLLLARMSESLVAQASGIAGGSILATEIQRRMCTDLLRLALTPPRFHSSARRSAGSSSSTTSSSSSGGANRGRPRPQPARRGPGNICDDACPEAANAARLVRRMVGCEPDDTHDDDNDETHGDDNDRGPGISQEAILDALQLIGEESRRRTIAEHQAHNDYIASHPELGALPVPVPTEPRQAVQPDARVMPVSPGKPGEPRKPGALGSPGASGAKEDDRARPPP